MDDTIHVTVTDVLQTMNDSSTSESIDASENTYTDYYFYEYDEYMYPGYTFERPFYLFIWEILVAVTLIYNMLVLTVFSRRKMFSPTVIILCAIAISDSLTGLVTLPTYIMVFQAHESAFLPTDALFNSNAYYSQINEQKNLTELKDTKITNTTTITSINTTQYYETKTMAPIEGYALSKTLCHGFMITKFFLSNSFHTVSMYLTLFLAIQRYNSIVNPFTAEALFRLKKTTVYCVVIFVLTPVLHSYHLFGDRATNGMCQWEISETGCDANCVYLWAAFIVRHFVPCLALIFFTVLFIYKLRKVGRQFAKMASCKKQITTRINENRRISFIVTAIVICRLLPEIPYCVFLLYNGIDKSVNNGENIHLKTNRIFHMSYELLLMISFQCNFYIYVILNRNFRSCLFGKCKKILNSGNSNHLQGEGKSRGNISETVLTSITERKCTD